jgi:ribonuclease R
MIKSCFRATYEEIGEIINSEAYEIKKRYEPILSEIFIMLELSEILRKKRFEKGSIDFNLPEIEIKFDNKGKVSDIVKIERNAAHILIEEFMLLANETVANYLSSKNIPLLYRVHEPPDEEKLFNISNFLSKFGIYSNLQSPKDIQKALDELHGKSFEKLINYLFLRSMKQAVYQPENIGHYALAKDNYTHFTSPIRRYPDLINHRILRRAVNKKITNAYIDKLMSKLSEIGIQCSAKERNAADAEREIIDILKLEYIEDKIGIEYNGTITGVNSFGFFVEIDNILVEGLVPLRNLTDDYYTYIETEYMVRGKKRGNFFRLGDRIIVKVDKVDKINKRLDFVLIEKINDN